MRIRATREDLRLSRDGGRNDADGPSIRSWRLVMPFGPPEQRHNLVVRASDIALLLRGAALVERPVNRIIGADSQMICGRLADRCTSVLEQATRDYIDRTTAPDEAAPLAWIALFFDGVLAAGERPPIEVQMIEGGARGGARTPEVMAWVESTLTREGRADGMTATNEIDVAIDINASKGTVCYVRESNLRITAPPSTVEHHVAAALRLSADIIQAQAIFDAFAERIRGGVHRTAQRARAVRDLPPAVQARLQDLSTGIRTSARRAEAHFWPEEPDFFFMQFDEDAIAAERAAEAEQATAAAAEADRLDRMQPAAIEDVLDGDFSGIADAVETKNLAAVAANDEYMPFLDDEMAAPAPPAPGPVPDRSAADHPVSPGPHPSGRQATGQQPEGQKPAGPEPKGPEPKGPASTVQASTVPAPPLPDTGDPPAEDLLDVALMLKRLIDKVVDGLAMPTVQTELHRVFTRVAGMLTRADDPKPPSQPAPPDGPSEADLHSLLRQLKMLSDQLEAVRDLPSLQAGLTALLDRVNDMMAQERQQKKPKPTIALRSLTDQERDDVMEISEVLQDLAGRVNGGIAMGDVQKELSALLERVNTMATQHDFA